MVSRDAFICKSLSEGENRRTEFCLLAVERSLNLRPPFATVIIYPVRDEAVHQQPSVGDPNGYGHPEDNDNECPEQVEGRHQNRLKRLADPAA
ncbi:hypothetical protein [Microbacterium testaceum]|uniref:hypothetical protein n=1 Tax=Microbacterium testaceum TaxID=2033 RepID=UPI0027D8740C|nr:hypothetical protein [Microbacterium testaceum]